MHPQVRVKEMFLTTADLGIFYEWESTARGSPGFGQSHERELGLRVLSMRLQDFNGHSMVVSVIRILP
jgi:hypothetical protein